LSEYPTQQKGRRSKIKIHFPQPFSAPLSSVSFVMKERLKMVSPLLTEKSGVARILHTTRTHGLPGSNIFELKIFNARKSRLHVSVYQGD
jgi:hypothetical protein